MITGTSDAPKPTVAMNKARRTLDVLPNVQILSDWLWVASASRWALHIELSVQERNRFVPQKSAWYFVTNSTYPWGSLECYPAVQNGIAFQVDSSPFKASL